MAKKEEIKIDRACGYASYSARDEERLARGLPAGARDEMTTVNSIPSHKAPTLQATPSQQLW